MQDDLTKVRKRSFQYWFSDGLPEIGLSIVFLMLGAYFLLQVRLPEGTTLRFILDSGFILVFLGVWFGAGYLVRVLKNRITYPRTGYVSYPKKSPRNRIFTMLISMAIASSLSSLFIMSPSNLAWMPAYTGILVSALLVYLGWRTDLKRFHLLAVLSLGLALFLGLITQDNLYGLSLYYLAMAPLLLISGSITLAVYLRQTAAEVEAQHGE